MSKYKRLTEYDKAEIMKMKALGYSNQEIGDKIGCSVPTISYHLKQIRERAERESDGDDLFWGLVAILAGMGVLELMRRLNK
ncbi:MAG: hypothetical protein DRP85_09785 [Candidatus Makaraimicrobium thalassicum]|nr:MAG: hypothetical protein DRP85_09785 [Candidatus Omnitrophota bacterium]